jgi:hypothetical protein
MNRFIEHVFAVIGCLTVTVGAVIGVLVGTGILKLSGTLERHDDD